MTRRLGIAILAAALAAVVASPAWSGTVYVPLAFHHETANGLTIETQVRFTNGSDERRELTYLFWPEATDGTVPDRAMESVQLTLAPRESRVLNDLLPPGSRGVLEVSADPEIAVSSRLVGTSAAGWKRPGTDLPVVTSDRLVPAGETVLLQGFRRDPKRFSTDFYILNLSPQEEVCSVSLFRRSGHRVVDESFTVPALGLLAFDDVLGLVGEANRFEVSAEVVCDGPFHPFAVTLDLGTAELVYIPPSGSGRSSLAPPDPAGGPPGPGLEPVVDCPAEALFERRGAFHRPEPGKETRRFEMPTPAGQRLRRLVIDLDFIPDEWSTPSNGNHGVIWVNRGQRWGGNVFAYVNVFGPGKDIAKMSTNADLPDRSPLQAFSRRASFEKGVRYHLHYVYDTGSRTMEAIFTAHPGTTDEEVVARITGTTTTGVIRTEEPGFLAYFGHPAQSAGPEVPTYGWLYANLCVQLD